MTDREEGFHDYTVSSTFEKFVAVLEAALLHCVRDRGGGKTRQVVVLPHGFECRREDYVLTWYDAPGVDDTLAWPIQSYGLKFHEWFFPEAFFLIEPDSYSRRILHDQEFSTILSAVCVAMNALKASGHDDVCSHPVYVPKHDARRDAYGGVRVSSDGLQRFECDSIHGSVGLGIEHVSDVENRMALLSSRLSTRDVGDEMSCWRRVTYQVYQENNEMEDSSVSSWDSDMPWRPWVRQEDPVGGVEVDALYGNEDGSLDDALRVRILAMAADHAPDSGNRSFLPLQVTDVSRKFLQCVNVCRGDEAPPVQSSGGFAATLRDFLTWLTTVKNVDNVSYLASEDWWVEHAERYEMEVDLDDVAKLLDMTFDDQGRDIFESFALHATIPDSLRGLAQMWKHFLKRVRQEYWESNWMVPHIPKDHENCCSILRALGSLNYSMSQIQSMEDYHMKTSEDRWVVEALDITLLDNPTVNIQVPVTQSLSHSNVVGFEADGEASKLVYENMLLSDMESFKFVNQGCRYEDFIRWYSPKDWDSDAMQLSHRMAGDCVWTRAWEKAQARPLFEQPKSLFDPKGRGEQILHQLETITPQDLMCQMFVSLFSSACSIMAEAYPNAGDVVKDQVACLQKASHEVFDVDHLLDKTPDMKHLVSMLSCIEHTIAAAVSLHQRLDGMEATVRNALVNGMIKSACDQRQGYELGKDHTKALEDCANADTKLSLDGPISTEYSVEVTDPSDTRPVKHRLFIACLPRELRIATAIQDQ